jgi:hypothetical protein
MKGFVLDQSPQLQPRFVELRFAIANGARKYFSYLLVFVTMDIVQ